MGNKENKVCPIMLTSKQAYYDTNGAISYDYHYGNCLKEKCMAYQESVVTLKEIRFKVKQCKMLEK